MEDINSTRLASDSNYSLGFVSDIRLKNPPYNTVLMGWLTVPVAIIGFLAGVVCLVWVARFTTMRRSTRALLISMIISSLLFSGLGIPVTSYTLILGEQNVFATGEYPDVCKAFAFIYYFSMNTCAYSHAAVAINRLYIVVFADRYEFLTSQLLTGFMVVVVWILSPSIYLWPLYDSGGYFGWIPVQSKCYLVSTTSFFTILYKLLYSLVPLSIMLFCYCVILIHAGYSRRKLRRIRTVDLNAGRTSVLPPSRADHREWKATRVMFFSCLGFVITYVPVAMLGFIGLDSRVYLRSILVIFLQIGCAMNPFLNTFLSSDSRSNPCGCHRLRSRWITSASKT